jgi:hypothetical protein
MHFHALARANRPARLLQGKAAKKGKTVADDNGPAGGDGEDEKPAYVHVRARRGQATDSHSLAERVSSPLIFSLSRRRRRWMSEIRFGCRGDLCQ